MLIISGVQIKNHQIVPWAGYKSAYKQCNIKEKCNIKSKAVEKLYDENVWHVDITKRIVLPFFMHLIIIFVPILAKS